MTRVLESRLAVAVVTFVAAAMLFGSGAAVAYSVPNNSVTSAKIVNGAVSSADIKDATITNRDVAVNQRIFPINFRGGNVTDQPLLSLNGITLRVSCSGSVETITVRKTNTVAAHIAVMSNDAGATDNSAAQVRGNFDDSFTNGEVFPAGPEGGSPSERIYTLVYSAQNGRNVTATFVTEDSFGPDNCLVSGYAIG